MRPQWQKKGYQENSLPFHMHYTRVPQDYALDFRLVIIIKTASKTGITFPWKIYIEMKLLGFNFNWSGARVSCAMGNNVQNSRGLVFFERKNLCVHTHKCALRYWCCIYPCPWCFLQKRKGTLRKSHHLTVPTFNKGSSLEESTVNMF